MRDVLTPAEVAERLRMDVVSVTRGSLRRDLPWVRLGRRLRMLSTALDEYMEKASRLDRTSSPRNETPAIPVHTPRRNATQSAASGWVYAIWLSNSDMVKIGRTLRLSQRIGAIRTQGANELELLNAAYLKNYRQYELELHARFAARRQRGEWFTLDESQRDELSELISGFQRFDRSGLTLTNLGEFCRATETLDPPAECGNCGAGVFPHPAQLGDHWCLGCVRMTDEPGSEPKDEHGASIH